MQYRAEATSKRRSRNGAAGPESAGATGSNNLLSRVQGVARASSAQRSILPRPERAYSGDVHNVAVVSALMRFIAICDVNRSPIDGGRTI